MLISAKISRNNFYTGNSTRGTKKPMGPRDVKAIERKLKTEYTIEIEK